MFLTAIEFVKRFSHIIFSYNLSQQTEKNLGQALSLHVSFIILSV